MAMAMTKKITQRILWHELAYRLNIKHTDTKLSIYFEQSDEEMMLNIIKSTKLGAGSTEEQVSIHAN